jgi:DNA polymerase III epsilon subunit-like protein
MVAGKKIISSVVERLMEDVSLVIAHNAAFDRGFVDQRFTFFKAKHGAALFHKYPGEVMVSAVLPWSFFATEWVFILVVTEQL